MTDDEKADLAMCIKDSADSFAEKQNFHTAKELAELATKFAMKCLETDLEEDTDPKGV